MVKVTEQKALEDENKMDMETPEGQDMMMGKPESDKDKDVWNQTEY